MYASGSGHAPASCHVRWCVLGYELLTVCRSWVTVRHAGSRGHTMLTFLHVLQAQKEKDEDKEREVEKEEIWFITTDAGYGQELRKQNLLYVRYFTLAYVAAFLVSFLESLHTVYASI